MAGPDRPYISIAFANRNDGYGGDLEARICKFIDYYARYSSQWSGLFEFVICDWNPPSDRPRLREAFEWGKLGNVVHVEVPPEVHLAISGATSRNMLDYIGRNVAIRRGQGEFSLVLNQDIFLSGSILEFFAERRLSDRHFYRADRCDFDFEPCRSVPPEDFEDAALANVFAIYRAHDPSGRAISARVQPDRIAAEGTRMQPGDRFDWKAGIIECRASSGKLMSDRRRSTGWRGALEPRERRQAWHSARNSSDYFQQFYLHTNASGDFIVAPRSAFSQIHGMNEAKDFYMHLDSYAVVQMFSAGYEQAVFSFPHFVFHADHDRSSRLDYQEPVTWAEHQSELSRILRDESPFRINPSNWGLADFDLPVFRASRN